MNESTESDLAAERDRLQAEVARLRVARDTGVPVDLLSDTTTEEAARGLAQELIAWKAATAPAPPPATAAAQYQVGQISRNTLGLLSPDQQLAVWRQGRLEGIGAPAPGERRNGEHHAQA